MKFLIAIATLFLGLNAFAGPEEHKEKQICYINEAALNTKEGPRVIFAPLQICLEEISIDLVNQHISVSSYFQPEFYKNISLKSLTRRNEDFYTFAATSLLPNTATGSHSNQIATDILSISGLSDNYGAVNATRLNISVTHQFGAASDTTTPASVTYTYQLL